MKQITLENYRCFHRKQEVPLEPLTLLVGDNSTGKTSFLAIIRALWDCIYDYNHSDFPNFKEPPFDLGSYDEIAHHQSKTSSSASSFEAGSIINQGFTTKFKFAKSGTVPKPVSLWQIDGDNKIHLFLDPQGNHKVHVATRRGKWQLRSNTDTHGRFAMSLLSLRIYLPRIIRGIFDRDRVEYQENLIPINGSPPSPKRMLIQS